MEQEIKTGTVWIAAVDGRVYSKVRVTSDERGIVGFERMDTSGHGLRYGSMLRVRFLVSYKRGRSR